MANVKDIQKVFECISNKMTQNRDYLIELDAKNGDGDLGISMDTGFRAVSSFFHTESEPDLGRMFMNAGKVLNEHAPSSLGTIISFAFMGIAKALKGKQSATPDEIIAAMEAGVRLVMEKAESKPGEKTILDAVCPALDALTQSIGEEEKERFTKAAKAAAEGSEATKQMRSVHGRAAYYGDKSIGILDGGSVVGKLIFEGIAEAI